MVGGQGTLWAQDTYSWLSACFVWDCVCLCEWHKECTLTVWMRCVFSAESLWWNRDPVRLCARLCYRVSPRRVNARVCYSLHICAVCVCLFSCLCLSMLLCVHAHSVCISQHAVWLWWPCFGWLMCWREQQGAQVGPEPQSDTLLLPCCFTYVDAARLPPPHLTLPPAQRSQHSQVCFRVLFWSSCFSQESKSNILSCLSNFLFHLLHLIVTFCKTCITVGHGVSYIIKDQ